MSSVTTATASVISAETLLLELAQSKGTEFKVAAIVAALRDLVERAYVRSNDLEQWNGKGSTARPLRPLWAFAFAKNDKGRQQSSTVARVIRAVGELLTEAAKDKRRDKSAEGFEEFFLGVVATVQAIASPARKAKEGSDEGKDEKAFAKAYDLVCTKVHSMSEEQASRLLALLLGRAPSMPSAETASKDETAKDTAATA